MILIKIYLVLVFIHTIGFSLFTKLFQSKPLNKYTWMGIIMVAAVFPMFWITQLRNYFKK
jgi:uncharacterized membrane protein